MRSTELPPTQWSRYLAAVSSADGGVPTCVGTSPGTGRGSLHGSAAWPLRRLHYDGARDLVELALGGGSAERPELRCYVHAPVRIVAIEAARVLVLLIVDANGRRTVVWMDRGLRTAPVVSFRRRVLPVRRIACGPRGTRRRPAALRACPGELCPAGRRPR